VVKVASASSHDPTPDQGRILIAALAHSQGHRQHTMIIARRMRMAGLRVCPSDKAANGLRTLLPLIVGEHHEQDDLA